MRGIRGVAIGLGALLLALVVAAVLFAPAVLDALLTNALRAQGFKNPSLDVASVSPGGVALRNVRAGAEPSAPDILVGEIDVSFGLGELIARRKVKAIRVRDSSIRAEIASDGAISLAGFLVKPGSGASGGGAPFGALAFDDVKFKVASAGALGGEFEGTVSGDVDRANGGMLRVDARGGVASGSMKGDEIAAALEAELNPDGGLTFDASGAGDLSGSGFSFPKTSISVAGRGAGWRAIFGDAAAALSADAELRVSAPPAPAADNPLIAGFLSNRGDSNGRMISADARLDLGWNAGVLAVTAPASPAAKIGDGEGALTISSLDGAPLARLAGGVRRLALSAKISGADVGGEATLRASTANAGPWQFQSTGHFGDQTLWGYALGETLYSTEGEADAKGFSAEAVVSTLVRKASIGRLTILDAPVVARANVVGDFAARTATVTSLAEECVRIAGARLMLQGQDSEARLQGALFCRADGPLVVARWGDDPHADVRGALTAATASYRIAATRFEGAPPELDVVASYDPDLQLTVVDAALSGGRVILNGAIVGTEAKGVLTGRLDGDKMSGAARLDRVVLAQNAKTLMVAPVVATGNARLAEEKINFDYDAKTLSGQPLGDGKGVHDIKTGRGETAFKTGELLFERGKLQPAAFILSLRGIVGETVGRASAETRFAWGQKPTDFRSSGDFSLKDLRFVGPGRAVTQTVGVNGDIRLSSLAPLKSEGEQSIKVGLLDLDALQLENGEIRFRLPGDETLQVVQAEFPWFGGKIGAYDASAPLTGGDTRMELKADNVDLGRMLEFVNVEGLSGDGVVEGVLPILVKDGRARIDQGVMSAKGPGVLRYAGKAAEAAAASNPQAKLAFDILRELHFDELTAKIDGPLDGALQFNVVFKGINEVTAGKNRVASPVVYRISIEAPLLALLDQARVSTDFRLQLDRLKDEEGATP